MKHAIYVLAVIVLLGIVAGCGGSKTHWITSPYEGTVRGVETLPPDDDIDVGVDTWVKVHWPDSNYAPPPRFQFRLERETGVNRFEGVKTTQEDSFPDDGIWWFAPDKDLDFNEVYRVTIEDDLGNIYRAYFVTESNRSREDGRAAQKNFRPAGAEGKKPQGTGALEHTVETGSSVERAK